MKKELTIYYSYLKLDNLNTLYHLINMYNKKFNMLIPSNYRIDYSKSMNKYEDRGNIYFYNEKYTFELNYIKTTKNEFEKKRDQKKGKNIFTNYKNQFFYEVLENSKDSLYMYYEEFEFIISSNHKYNINELFDAYLILFSVSIKSISNDYQLLKELTILKNNGISMYAEGVDLLTCNLSMINDDMIEIVDSKVFALLDDDFLQYKELINKVDIINSDVFVIKNNYDSWIFEGIYDLKYLGKHSKGKVKNYDEIDNSALTNKEKEDLIVKLIIHKKNEIQGFYDKIKINFYNLLINDIKKNMNYDIWKKTHFIEFINVNNLDYGQVNDQLIYEMFMQYIQDVKEDEYQKIKYIFNTNRVRKSMIGDDLVISPGGCNIVVSGLNYYINGVSIKVNDNYEIILNS